MAAKKPKSTRKQDTSRKQDSLAEGLQTFAELNLQSAEKEQKFKKIEILEQELETYRVKEQDAKYRRQNTDFEALAKKHKGNLLDLTKFEEPVNPNDSESESESESETYIMPGGGDGTENELGFSPFSPDSNSTPPTSPETETLSDSDLERVVKQATRMAKLRPGSPKYLSAFGRNTSSIYTAEAGHMCPHCQYSILEECTSFAGTPCEFFVFCENCNAYICTYKPMEHQTLFHIDNHSFKLYAGGFGSAKTYTCGMEFIGTVLQIPMSQGLVGAATWSQCEDTCLKFLKDNIPEKLIASSKQDKVSWNMTLINGSKIFAKALNAEGKIRSANLSIIWIEEASEVSWAVVAFLKARLRNKVGFYKGKDRLKMILSSNPDVGWLNSEWLMSSSEIYYHGNVPDRYFVPPEKKDKNVVTHIAATSSNVHLPPDYEEKLSRNKEQWWINRYLKGSFKYAEGLVYPNFDRWFVEPFNIPKHWRRITGTDFGRRDPTAHVVAALDPIRRIIYTYNEVYDTLDDKPASTIIDKVKKAHDFPPYLLAYPHQADPRGRNKDQTSGRSWFDVFREKDIIFSPAEGCEAKSLAATIQKVAEYGEAGRLKIFRNCVHTYDELSKYKYPERKLGDDANQGEIPQDRNNHLPDAIRYMLAPFPAFPQNTEDFSVVWQQVMERVQETHNPLSLGFNAYRPDPYVSSFIDNFG